MGTPQGTEDSGDGQDRPTLSRRDRLHAAMHIDTFMSDALFACVEEFGGLSAAAAMDADPLPDEPFDWDAIAPADHAMVRDVLNAVEGAELERVSPEYPVILRRLVARAASDRAAPLRRRASHERIAAAMAWIALRGNHDLGRHRLTAEMLWWRFGTSSCAELAREIADSLGMLETQDCAPPADRYLVQLRDPALMHTRRREQGLAQLDGLITVIERNEASRRAQRPVQPRADGSFKIAGRDVSFAGCVKGPNEFGRATVMVLLGDSIAEADDCIALSVPDARRLAQQLGSALDASLIGLPRP